MKILVVNTDYPDFIDDLYARHPGLAEQPFEQQRQIRADSLFSVADFYRQNLERLGHEAFVIDANNERMQRAWAREHDTRVPRIRVRPRLRRGVVPWLSRDRRPMLEGILAAQIEHLRPDVLLNHAMDLGTAFFARIKQHVRLLVGEHAATTLSEREDWSIYDLVISSFPPTLDWFRRRGVPAELNRLAFEPSVLERVTFGERSVPVSFVGSFFNVHRSRTELLERLAGEVPLQVWGSAPRAGFGTSPLAGCYQGTAWGLDMFNILAKSRIVLNHHGDVAPFANNMRLYEATGVGALLVTDWRQNLPDLFSPGREVIAYSTPDECIAAVKRYLEDEDGRRAIAQQGQQRTLSEHTYARRMQHLLTVFDRYL